MKIYDGTNWQDAKSLKIHNGSSWSSAIKGWVYNGGWQLSYPNSPVSLSGPTFTYSRTAYPSPGSTWTANHTWNNDAAYIPTFYTYQWKRGSSSISGATSQTYTATVSDVDQVLGVTIIATNARGSTTISGSSETIILPMLSSMTAYDSTPTPSQPSVSISSSNLNYSGSWTSSSNATTYSVSTNNGTVSPSGQTFTGSGSAGSVAVSVTPINTNKQVYIYWAAATGASSYDIVKYGNSITTTVNVSSSTTNYIWSIADGNEENYFTVYPKSPAGFQGYGIQTSVTVSNKTGTAGSATTTLVATPPPSGGSASLTPSGTVQARSTISASTYFSSGNPTSYEIQIRKATGVSPDENSGSQVVFSSTQNTSYIVTDGEASGTPDQFAAFGRAYSAAGGWSAWVKSNTVNSTPYVAPIITYTATYNANGGSPNGTSTYTAGGSTTAPGAPSRSGYTFNGWYDAPSADFVYSVGAGGTWYPPSNNISMYARWTAVVTGSAPTITVSNSYDGKIGGSYQWTLTINNTSSTAATSFDWGVQFSSSSGGSVGASATGSGGSIPAGGSVTVTRNNATYIWARWVSVTASNGYGTSSALTTGWA